MNASPAFPELRLPRGAQLVPTPQLQLVRRLGEEVLNHAGILQLEGLPGTGKTSAAVDLCRHLGVEPIWLHLAGITKGNDVLRELLQKLGEDTSGSASLLLWRAREIFDELRVLIVVDEAHLLRRAPLHQIRYLFDQPKSRFGLLLTGNDFGEAWRVAPELRSRVSRYVGFGPIPAARLVSQLAAFHPVLAKTAPDLLKRIDGEHCQGNWREWSQVLEAAIARGAGAETGISKELARGVLGALPPPPGSRPRRGRR